MGKLISMKDLASVLPDLLIYKPDTGKLFWKSRPSAKPQWNARFSGREAFTARNSSGYPHGTVMGRTISAHRTIWCLQTGCWPQGDLDHINMVRHDNRWANLRLATRSENARNTKTRPNASSSFFGVGFHSQSGKWAARIRRDGKQKHLGLFASEIEAAQAYDEAVLRCRDRFLPRNFAGGEV